MHRSLDLSVADPTAVAGDAGQRGVPRNRIHQLTHDGRRSLPIAERGGASGHGPATQSEPHGCPVEQVAPPTRIGRQQDAVAIPQIAIGVA